MMAGMTKNNISSMTFVIRQLNEGTSLGEKLHSMRKSANLTLSEIAEKTKIRKLYLQAFEAGEYDSLPEPLYAKKFLRKYVEELGGDVPYFLQCYDAEYDAQNREEPQHPQSTDARPRFSISLNRIFKVGSLIALSLAIVGYVGWQISSLIAPPTITVHSPEDGTVTTNVTLDIRGEAEDETNIQINGEPVLMNTNGRFTKEVALRRGMNLITIKAAKRYSRETTIERRVILDQKTVGQSTFSSDIP